MALFTYMATQIKCLAESICLTILCDSLALQCGFTQFCTILLISECLQHGNESLITNETSLTECCSARFLRLFKYKYSASAETTRPPTSQTTGMPYFIIFSIIIRSKEQQQIRTCKRDWSRLKVCLIVIAECFVYYLRNVRKTIKCSTWNGRTQRHWFRRTRLISMAFLLTYEFVLLEFQCCHKMSHSKHTHTHTINSYFVCW